MQIEDTEAEKVGDWRNDISFRKKDDEESQTKSFGTWRDVLRSEVILINVSNIMHQNNIIK